MLYSPLVMVHIAAGTLGVLSGSTALVVRKGGRVHRSAGNVFVGAMLFMAAAGAIAAFRRWQPGNLVAGVFTLYLVSTAWLTVRRRKDQAGHAELGLLLYGLAAAALTLSLAWRAAHGGTGSTTADSTVGYLVFGTLMLIFCAGDARLIARRGISGASRLVRHLGRMCLALLIAAGSFFLGQSGDPVLRRIGLRARLFPPAIRRTQLPAVPVILIVALTLFWLWRVQTAKTWRKPDPAA